MNINDPFLYTLCLLISRTYRGIIAVVSVPKSSLLPTHNKQDFNDHAEYKKLKKCVDQAMQQYWEEVVMGELSSHMFSLFVNFLRELKLLLYTSVRILEIATCT